MIDTLYYYSMPHFFTSDGTKIKKDDECGLTVYKNAVRPRRSFSLKFLLCFRSGPLAGFLISRPISSSCLLLTLFRLFKCIVVRMYVLFVRAGGLRRV